MISITAFDAIAFLYLVSWPWIAAVLLLLLLSLWHLRGDYPRAYATILTVLIVGTLPGSFYWASEWLDGLHASRESDYWDSVSNASKSGNAHEAIRLLATRENGLQDYVVRSIRLEDEIPDSEVLRAAFEQCVDLLDDAGLPSTMLYDAVHRGQVEIIEAWLATPPCLNDNATREERIGSSLGLLVPYVSHWESEAQRRIYDRQAAALKALVKRYPSLTNVQLPDDCRKSQPGDASCTLVKALLDEWHQDGVMAILPLDKQASEHLPPVVLHILQGDNIAAAQSAKKDPQVFHHYLAQLMATAPSDSLRAALRAAPPDENSLLTLKDGNTQFQQLAPLFDAAKRRDEGKPYWQFLSMLFDLFPTRMNEIDTSLYESYVIGTTPGEPKLDHLLTRLRSNGLSCDGFSTLAAWGTSGKDEDVQWYSNKSGCVLKRNSWDASVTPTDGASAAH